jgi:hypothetical protein
MRLAAQCRTALSSLYMKRHFHSSLSPRQVFDNQIFDNQELEEIDDMDTFDMNDVVTAFSETEPTSESTSAGHLKMRQDRHLLHYLRLIEHEVPELVGT